MDWQELIDQIVTCNFAKHGSLDPEEQGFRIHVFVDIIEYMKRLLRERLTELGAQRVSSVWGRERKH